MPGGRTSSDFIRLRYGRLAWWVFMVITAIYTPVSDDPGDGCRPVAASAFSFDYHVGMVVVIGVATLYTLAACVR